ncbi:hypothetical protein BCY86_08645 [Pajaroellobacter abortibovis]|uniref:Uncharacterized protein n=1 Tax=Pajaroellobacter abortibovis TaxID=1882918 RepID=A0A1L6MZ67_9BACT|nr:hypothetical protein BCY86_08645 [Pajaroellobacter abortibovis]
MGEGKECGETREEKEFTWVIDLIDGTTAFAMGKPTYTFLATLVKSGIPLLGILDQPILKERWIGIQGEISTYNGTPITPSPLNPLLNASLQSTPPDTFLHPNERYCF